MDKLASGAVIRLAVLGNNHHQTVGSIPCLLRVLGPWRRLPEGRGICRRDTAQHQSSRRARHRPPIELASWTWHDLRQAAAEAIVKAQRQFADPLIAV